MGLLKINESLAIGETVRIEGEAMVRLHQRTRRVGDTFTIRDIDERDFRARIVSESSLYCEAIVFEAFGSPVESPVHIHLLQGLPKKERLEWIIQKATELGVFSIVPFESERSITLVERETPQPKAHRWQIIAVKAAQQCRRGRIPRVHPVLTFCDAIGLFRGSDLKLILWERENCQGLHRVLTAHSVPKSIALAVGPEGGFSAHELEMARQKGYTPVHLGQRILRTESAAIAATAVLQYQFGDLGREP